jgi:hypothetical protein
MHITPYIGNIFTKVQPIYDGKYWECYGILIPINIDTIPSMDRVIYASKEGTETLAAGINVKSYTLEEYQKKFAIVGHDGKLYWKT